MAISMFRLTDWLIDLIGWLVTDCCRLHESDVGFVVIVDRRQDKWASVKTLLLRISVSFRIYWLSLREKLQRNNAFLSNTLYRSGLGRLAAWHLSGGPVGPTAMWAATSNVERENGTEESGPLARDCSSRIHYLHGSRVPSDASAHRADHCLIRECHFKETVRTCTLPKLR